MNSDDEWIDQWKQSRRSDVPPTPEALTSEVMRRLDAAPEAYAARQVSPLLWIVRLTLVVFATILMAGRLIATAAVFFSSTPLQ